MSSQHARNAHLVRWPNKICTQAIFANGICSWFKMGLRKLQGCSPTLQKLLDVTISASADESKDEIKLCNMIVDSNDLPILCYKCIVPKSIASWNMRKSGSDMTAKMLEMRLIYLLGNSAQSKAM